jgi:hypothetical protein
MKLYRFSPIKTKEELMAALEYVHKSALALCKQAIGRYLPTSGIIAIFSHYHQEFEFLQRLGKELTDPNVSFNGKYFQLYEPLVMPDQDDIPGATYHYLYLRQPDRFRPQVGDVDFVLDETSFQKIQNLKIINGVEIFVRPEMKACELFSPDSDVLIYLTTQAVNVPQD